MEPRSMLHLPVIGRVHSPLKQKFGAPRQPRLVPVPAEIEFFAPYDDPAAFEGLKGFSHLWLIWAFHHNRDQQFRPLIRPPRLGGNQRIGVFASRSMYRPAPIGLSAVELMGRVVREGRMWLQIRGADLIDGTPILDIKPYVRYSDSIAEAQSGFAEQAPNGLPVIWSDRAQQDWQQLLRTGLVDASQQALIEQLLAQDPRPAYQAQQKNESESAREYGMAYDRVNVRFYMDPQGVQVVAVESASNPVHPRLAQPSTASE